MPQFGSSNNLVSQNLSQTMDNQGNPIISSDTTFGASPLGYAARVQALFGLPNATFELTPPDTTATINQGNQLPYWDIQDYSAGVMTATSVYDSTTNTWGVKLNPGTATTGDYLTMTTRSYLVNDDNLSLRQKALAVVAKNGTYSSTTQWNMNLVATYYDGANTVLHSGTVATILDNTTWTSMAGTTTTSGTAINGSAQYVDLTFTLTATAPVTSSTSVTIKSVLLSTSTAATSGFLVVNTYYANTTFTVPTGVTYADILCVGAGGGGGGGAVSLVSTGFVAWAIGGGGGSGGGFVYAPNQYIGGNASYAISVGAGGAGGAGTSYAKTGTAYLTTQLVNGNGASAGGASSFGSLVSATGGGGGTAGSAYNDNNSSATPRPSAGAGSPAVYPIAIVTSGRGGAAGSALPTDASTQGTARNAERSTIQTTGWTQLPLTTFVAAAGVSGGSATTTGFAGGSATVDTPGTAGNGTYVCAGGGSGSSSNGRLLAPRTFHFAAGSVFAGGGGGGASAAMYAGGAGTAIAGNGGAAAGTSGCGGGGGGGVSRYLDSTTNNTVVTMTSGNGAAGAGGFVVVAYVG